LSVVSRSSEQAGVVVVSHAYLEPEVAKSLDALAAHLSVRLVTPRRSPVLVFDDRRSDSLAGRPFEVVGLHRLPRQGVLFLFASLRLGLDCKPDHILIEYDPWTPIFWQVVLARALVSPRSRLHVVAKKNTFRRRPQWLAAVKTRLARMGLRRVSGVLAASRKVAALYRDEFDVAESLIDVVPMHPVDTDHFRPGCARHESARVRIGFVGRLHSQKGVDVLLDAVAELVAGGAAVELHAVGPMGDIGMLDRPGAPEGTYVWHRPVPNSEIAGFLQQLDIFVMPSARLPDHEEHDGRALLEAMATGIACVGSDSGIIPELLADDRGRLFPAGDAVALVRELSSLIDDPDERNRLGKEACVFVEQTASTHAAAAARASALCSIHREIEK
jgi:glycosyltransferase involved in cell wall biosynthesis